MNRIQEVVHRFRSGGVDRKEDRGRRDGSPSVFFTTSTPHSRHRTSEGAIHTISSGALLEDVGSTQWYVDPPVSIPTNSSMALPGNRRHCAQPSRSGLQQSMLAALGRSDPILISSGKGGMPGPVSPERKLCKSQPKGTLQYKVERNDTLEKIAARFEVTPSELKKLNRMSSRMVFENQLLYIPDPDYVPSASPSPQFETACSPVDDGRPKMDLPIIKLADKPPAHVPGHVMKVPSPPVSANPVTENVRAGPLRALSEDEARKLDEECYERFIKVCAQLISEGFDKVAGTLLVTPNAIMFDPDPVAEQDSVDMCSVVVFMDTIISAALYHDMSAMDYHSHHGSLDEVGRKPQIYQGDSVTYHCKSPTSTTTTIPDDSFEFIPSPVRVSDLPSLNIQQEEYSDVLYSGQYGRSFESSIDSEFTRVTSHCESEGSIEIIGDMSRRDFSDKIDLGTLTGETSTDDTIPLPVISNPAPFLNGQLSGNSPIPDLSKTISPQTAHQDSYSLSQSVLPSTQDRHHGDGQASDSRDISERAETTAFVESQQETIETARDGEWRVSEVGTSVVDERGGDVVAADGVLTLAEDASDSAGCSSVIGEDTDTGGVKSSTSSSADPAVELCAKTMMDEILQSVAETMGMDSATVFEWSSPDSAVQDVSVKPNALGQRDVRDVRTDDGRSVTTSAPDEQKREDAKGKTGFPIRKWHAEEDEDNCYVDMSDVPISTQPKRSTDTITNTTSITTLPSQASMGDDSAGTLLKSESLNSSIQQPSSLTNGNDTAAFFGSSFDNFSNVRVIRDLPVVRERKPTPADVDSEPKGKLAEGTGAAVSSDGSSQVLVKSAVKAEERPELFRQVSDLIPQQEDVHSQPAIYLHLRVDEGECDRRVTSSIPSESYRHQKTKSHYWFSFPRHKADHLYAFFVQWHPEVYGEDGIEPEKRGFVVVNEKDLDEDTENLSFVDDYFGPSRNSIKKNWELICREEALRRGSLLMAQTLLPELLDTSVILTSHTHLLQVSETLPPITTGCQWELVYSTAKHGYSLKRLYRETSSISSPVLLVLQDSDDTVFGAYLSDPPRYSDHFFGNGTCRLWTFKDKFQSFDWACHNDHFIKGDENSLIVGASGGMYGLWLDDSLDRGRSRPCGTFNNVVLSRQEDFHVQALEVWTFI